MFVLLILFAYASLCVAVCLFRRLMSFLAMAGLCFSIYEIFFAHRLGIGLLVLVMASFLSVLVSIANGEMEKEERKRETRRRSASLGNWVFYVIPIFWPFLIVRAILCGKTRPADMTPYDYEQHLKCNAR